MPVPVFAEKTTLGDLLRYEHDQDYTRDSANVFNRSGDAVELSNPMGYPLIADGASDYALAKAGDENDVIALLLSEKKLSLADDGSFKAAVLVRGPAIVNKGALPLKDYADANFTTATIVTALATLSPPVLAKSEHAVTDTQVK